MKLAKYSITKEYLLCIWYYSDNALKIKTFHYTFCWVSRDKYVIIMFCKHSHYDKVIYKCSWNVRNNHCFKHFLLVMWKLKKRRNNPFLTFCNHYLNITFLTFFQCSALREPYQNISQSSQNLLLLAAYL